MYKAVQSTMEAILTRLGNLEGAFTLQGRDGEMRSLSQSFIDLETWALPMLNRPAPTVETVEMLIDAKIRTAIMGVQSSQRLHGDASSKPILESKAIQEIGKLTEAKGYRQWNKKMKNALEQTRRQSRGMLEVVEKLTEEEVIEFYSLNNCEYYGEAIIDLMMNVTQTAAEERWK